MIFLNSFVLVFILYTGSSTALDSWRNVFDSELYENVLDPVQCTEQLGYIVNNSPLLRMQFFDTSLRTPRGITKGNTRDLGNYFQCLEISQEVENMDIKGKYCLVDFPLDQGDFEIPTWPTFPDISIPDVNITWPDLNITWPGTGSRDSLLKFPWNEFDHKTSFFTDDVKNKLQRYEQTKFALKRLLGESDTTVGRTADGALAGLSLELALCIPKVCTPKQALDYYTFNLTSTLTHTENFCRLPNDKNWVPVDTVAIVILSIIGLITLISTAYDIRHTIILEQDPKKANKIYQSFSVYTNTKNFFVFPSGANVITCLDGIRSFAMIWVIIGHTYVTQLTFIPENMFDIISFVQKFTSLWITSGTITVDTFFAISGLLVVYTTAAKVSRIALLKNLHLFYLNRLLRMFPVLAFGVLMTASFLYRTTDGPYFVLISQFVNNCRTNWWSTLLYVQNFVNPGSMCLPHSWYLAIDMHLHFFSPVVLFWVLGQRKRSAWSALIIALVAFLIASSIYNFMNDFPSTVVSLSRPLESENYLYNYYVHTLPRASPFFVGMIFGYLLHLYRGKKPRIPKVLVILLWVLALAGTSLVCVVTYWNIQIDWDNQLMDNMFNSYKRPIWAISIGWLIFACHTGHGGPINWILSIHAFKILGRLSYAMYILHYPMIYLINATTLAPIYFSIHFSMYRFLIDFSLAIIAAFLVTVVIDFPFANLIKMAIGPGPKKPPPLKKSLANDVPELNFTSVNVVDDEKKTYL